MDAVTRGIRVRQWLEDEAVQEVLTDLRNQNYELFVGARDEAGRQMAQAQALVLRAFEAGLRAIVDHGEVEAHDREQRDQNATAR